jgi:asparagine synthase (glutamine-hydrolysing)
MCGIFGILGSTATGQKTHERAAEAASKLSHRGPDWSGMKTFQHKGFSFAIAHERLQIIDPQGGEQPIQDKEQLRILSINGEIYNYKTLLASDKVAPYLPGILSKSDCEVIIPLWKYYTSLISSDLKDSYSESQLMGAAISVNRDLDGDFAYVMWDQELETFMIARDPIGVDPLYIGYSDEDGSIIISSEMKAFSSEYVTDFREFPPGCVLVSKSFFVEDQTFDAWLDSKIRVYYTPMWKYKPLSFLPDSRAAIHVKIRELLTTAVRKRLMSDVPIGFLLSGGLDSSLICSIASRIRKEELKELAPIKTFSIGLKGSPDLAAARKVAEYLGTDHQEFEFTPDQGIAALPNVIYSLETFDTTTCRAATPMFLLARRIKALGIKVLLSGEGADEAMAGYLYFHKAPNKIELYEETVDKILGLSKYDCLRANKSVAAWGCEIRVPFLDSDFLSYAMMIDPAYKMISSKKDQDPSNEDSAKMGPMEKWILREAFHGYLPDEILYRQKEQFSDGVGYNWIDSLKKLAETTVKDKQLQNADIRFPEKTPKTKEAYFYRTHFNKRLTHPRAHIAVPWSRSVACSTERALRWVAEWQTMDEPSGRAVNIHESTTQT